MMRSETTTLALIAAIAIVSIAIGYEAGKAHQVAEQMHAIEAAVSADRKHRYVDVTPSQVDTSKVWVDIPEWHIENSTVYSGNAAQAPIPPPSTASTPSSQSATDIPFPLYNFPAPGYACAWQQISTPIDNVQYRSLVIWHKEPDGACDTTKYGIILNQLSRKP